MSSNWPVLKTTLAASWRSYVSTLSPTAIGKTLNILPAETL